MTSNQKQSSVMRRATLSSPYSEQRARQLRELLVAVRSQETQWMRSMRERPSPEESTLGDEGDSAAFSKDRELTASLAQLAVSRVAAVEGALERLREGRYGVCEECEEEIPLERLQAMPSTVLCVDCQRRRESSARHASADISNLWVVPKEPPTLGSDSVDSDSAPMAGSAEAPRRKRGRPRSRPAEV